MKTLPYEKTFIVTNATLESKEIAVLQLLDESSTPPNSVRTHVARISLQDFLDLGVTLNQKVKVTITVLPDQPKAPQT